jgi:hypothetical protein
MSPESRFTPQYNQPRSKGHPVREKEQKARKAKGASRLS